MIPMPKEQELAISVNHLVLRLVRLAHAREAEAIEDVGVLVVL